MNADNWIRLTAETYAAFALRFEQGEFGNQRLGQAAIDYFGLRENVEEDNPIYGLWEADKEQSKAKLEEAIRRYHL